MAAKKHHDKKEAEAQAQEQAPAEPAAAQPAAPEQPAAAEPATAAPAAAGGLTPEAMDQLKQLGELHEQNILSDRSSSARRRRCWAPEPPHAGIPSRRERSGPIQDLERRGQALVLEVLR